MLLCRPTAFHVHGASQQAAFVLILDLLFSARCLTNIVFEASHPKRRATTPNVTATHIVVVFFLFLFYLNIKSIWFYSMFIYIFHTMQRNEQSQPAPCLSCCVCLSRMVFIIVYMKHVIQCTTFLWHYLLRQSSLLGWGYNIVFRVERWYRIALHIHRTRVLCPPPMRYLMMCLSPVYLHIWFMTKY